MKKILLILCLSLLMLTVSCGVKLDDLDGYLGKHVAFSESDTKFREAKPYGVIIEKDGENYYATLWYDTLEGEKKGPKEQLNSSMIPGDGEIFSSMSIKDGALICSPTDKTYTDTLQTGKQYKNWVCQPATAEMIEVFDVTIEEAGVRLDKFTQLNSDISRERGIFGYKRLENTGTILNIDSSGDYILVELEKVNNMTIKLSNLLKISKGTGLSVGDSVTYRGRIVHIQLPMVEEDTVKLTLDDVIYKKN